MNSPSCHTTSQMRGVCTSFVLPAVGNMVSDSPFWRLISRKLSDLHNGSIDKARYSKGERVCKMNHSPQIGRWSANFNWGVTAKDTAKSRRAQACLIPETTLRRIHNCFASK